MPNMVSSLSSCYNRAGVDIGPAVVPVVTPVVTPVVMPVVAWWAVLG